jgi:hypothetical protein
MCERSIEFHMLLAEYTKRMDDLLTLLCTDINCTDATSTEAALNELDTHVRDAEHCGERLFSLGSDYVNQLSVTEYNSGGHEITRDYLAGIVHVRQVHKK